MTPPATDLAVVVDGPGEGRVDFAATTGSGVDYDLRSTATQHPTATLSVTVPAPQDLTDVVGTDQDDTVVGSTAANRINLKNGQDTYAVGEAFGGGAAEPFGADTVADFAAGDAVDLHPGLSVRSGLGTTTVTVWDGVTDFGTISAANGHLWAAGDFD